MSSSSSLNKISTLIDTQVPAFIREDHPIFVEFLQKYFEFLETPGNPVYELKKFEDNYDIDSTRASLLSYFKNKILPSFPDETELSTERIIKASRAFYAKKGTPDSFKFLFRVLYNKEVEVFFPKLQVLRASDGKWVQPQAFRLTLSAANANLNLDLIEKKKAYGSISRASCVIEAANRTLDKGTNREIVEIYVSNLNRFFQNGEFLEVDYVDGNGTAQTFSEKIIGAISNIKINPKRRGRKYLTGDPVVIAGGLDTTSQTRVKAVAEVGNVTTGSIDSATVTIRGYGFRTTPNALIDIYTANGVGANIIVNGVDTANAIQLSYCTDSILYKAGSLLNAANFSFDNIGTSTIATVIGNALTFENINTSPLLTLDVLNGGSFFDEEPILNVLSLYESDYSTDQGILTISPGQFNTYNNTAATIKFAGPFAQSANGYYNGFRLLVEKHFRTIVAYDGVSKTATLDRPFENNINQTNILTKNLYLDSRPMITSMGRIAAIEVLNGGTNYSATNTVQFIGTGVGATASLTVTSGTITGVTLTNRGEGYPVAPTVTVSSATGSGAILRAVLFGDGEDIDVVTGDIGQIKDFNIINRGSDYISTPNVSLKIYDINVASILESQSILEGEIVYQGANSNSTTFRATVDSYYPANNILRVYDFSGTPTVGQNLVVVKTTTANVNALVQYANVEGKVYPYKYGDGKAKANASFLNGLIKYNGFYLNTDGHISSDKRLQDSEKYHNYSYSLVSEVQAVDYAKTVSDTVHPSGTKLLSTFLILDNKTVSLNSNVNAHAIILTSNNLTNNCNVAYNSSVVTGTNENFDTVANTGDFIVINSANTYRKFTKVITAIANNNSLNIESPCVLIGEGRASTNSGNADLKISGNTVALPLLIDPSDRIRINVGNTILTKSITSISGNVITLNTATGITSSNTNLIYQILPQFNVVDYEIVRTIQS